MATIGTSEQQLNIQVLEFGPLSWVNIEKPHTAEMEYLREQYSFHQLSLDDCLSIVQLPKLDEFEDHLFLVLHFPRFNMESRITIASEVDVFAGATYVVTVHGGDLRPMTKLFHDCQANQELRREVMGHGSGFLLYRILDSLVDYCFPILGRIIGNVNSLEERVFDTRGQAVVREMALLRRDILSYRRVVRPQIEVLEAMEEKEVPFLKVDQDIYFGDLADHMRRIWSELEDLKEVVEGLYDAHGSLVTLRTNDIIRTLTVAASVVLPFLVVSGLYGMNVDLPAEEWGWSFGLLMLVTGLISIAMLVVFRLRRWL